MNKENERGEGVKRQRKHSTKDIHAKSGKHSETETDSKKKKKGKKREKTISEPTEGFRQQVLDELSMIPDMQHAVDTGVHQLLLVVAQVLGHVL